MTSKKNIDMQKRLEETKNSSAANFVGVSSKKNTNEKSTLNEDSVLYNKIDVKREVRFLKNFTRQTYYIENSLLEKINKMADDKKKAGEKGYKTKTVNEIVEYYFKNIGK